MSLDHCIAVLEPHLAEIFESFYDNILSDPHLGVYFHSDKQIKRLIDTQRRNIVGSLRLSGDDFTEHYAELGEYHHRLGVPLNAIEYSFEFLFKQMLRRLDSCPGCDLETFYDHMNAIRNGLAKGYLRNEALEFKLHLRMLDSLQRDSGFFKDHLEWFTRVVDQVLDGPKEDCADSCDAKHRFDRWLLSEESRKVVGRAEERSHIQLINTRLHINRGLLFYYIEGKGNFIQGYNVFNAMKESFLVFNDVLDSLDRRNVLRSAARDPLTDLVMRKDMPLILESETLNAVRAYRPVGLAALRIADLDDINDRFGHPAGDATLKAVSQGVREATRADDLVIRYGGATFVVLLPDADLDDAGTATDKLRRSLDQTTVERDGQTIAPSLRYAAGQYEPDREDSEEFVRRVVAMLTDGED